METAQYLAVLMIFMLLPRWCYGFGETCTDNDCAIRQVCGQSGTCECDSTHYPVAGQVQIQCLPKVELGYNCTSRNACATEYAICIGSGWTVSTCMCRANYYDTNTAQHIGGSCRIRIPLFSNCENGFSSRDQCKDPNANCDSTDDCRCNSGYHDETVNGDMNCKADKALGSSCRIASECSDSNADCYDYNCTCNVPFYDSNGFLTDGGNCFHASELRVLNIQFSVKTTSMGISWSPPAEGRDQYINKYRAIWYERNSTNGHGETVTSMQTGTGRLTPGETYRVVVSSVYRRMRGNVECIARVIVEQSAEPNPPTAVSLTEANLDARDKTIQLFWTSPVIGVVKDYEIQLLNADNSSITTVYAAVTYTFVSDATILNGFHYNVAIKSRSFGFLNSQSMLLYVFSKPLHFGIKTTVQVPDPPTNVICGKTANIYIRLTWTTPTFTNGDLVQYYVHVYSSQNRSLKVVSTSNSTTNAQIDDLQPGTYYNFRVYTENEKYNSSLYGQISVCKTKPRMSDAPQNLAITQLTSRGFKVSWRRPNNTYSEEILGYVLQIKEGDKCVKEINYKCSDCQGNFDNAPLSSELCHVGEKTDESKSNSELKTSTLMFRSDTFKPYTYYSILVAAVNDFGLGHQAQQSARSIEEVSDAPHNLAITEVTSRAFKISWRRPFDINSKEILGYVLQIMEGDLCLKEIKYKCSDCQESFDNAPLSSSLCNGGEKSDESKSESELNTSTLMSRITTFKPDTNYSILVAAVNPIGWGHQAQQSVRSKEEEPQSPPTAVTVTDVKKKSFNVSWSLIGPRPGHVTYTVILTSGIGADSKAYNVIGYENTHLFADGLEEYWNYVVNVRAETNVGSPKTSDSTHKYRTLPSAPGPVTNFGTEAAQLRTDYFYNITVRWKAPLLLERNSLIKEYVLIHNISSELKSLVFESQTSDDFYSQEFVMKPGTRYQFEVYAVNTESEDNIGQKSFITVTSPAELNDSNPKTGQTSMIVGIIVAVLVIAGVGIFILFWIRRRKRKSQEDSSQVFMLLENKNRKHCVGLQNDNNVVLTKDGTRLNVYENVIAGNHGELMTDIRKYNVVYVSGCMSEKDYILCFAPELKKVNDFWTMILEEEVDIIVMFAENRSAKKELRYWPSEFNKPKNYGRVTVEVTHVNTYETHTDMKIKISSRGSVRTINHYQCSPVSTYSPDGFVDLVKIVRSKKGRILLHSSEGRGSTVPFVVLDACMHQLSDGSRTEKVDYIKMLMNIMKTHKDLSLSQEWFIFTHDCVQILGCCDYERLQSAQIESVYQTLQVDD